MAIYLVRHGESVGNVDHSLYGKILNHQMGLTEKGLLQAKEAGKKISNDIIKGVRYTYPKVHIITSPFVRAMQTADGVAEAFSQKPFKHSRSTDYRIIEQIQGNFVEDVDGLDAKRAAYHKFYFKYPMGESGYDVLLRCLPFIKEIQDYPYKVNPLIIVSHSRTIRILRMLIEGRDAEWFHSQANFPNATIFRYNSIGYPEEPLKL